MTTGAKVGIGIGSVLALGLILYFSLTGKTEEVIDEAQAKAEAEATSGGVNRKDTLPLGTIIKGKPAAGTGKGMDGDLSLAGDIWGS